MKLIYLASPYSYKSKWKIVSWAVKWYRSRMVAKIAGWLQDTYPDHAFILPITMSHETIKFMNIKKSDFKTWANRDYAYLSRCDELWVARMDGWQSSEGVKAEIKYAKKLKIPIRHLKIAYVKEKIC